MEEEAEEYWSEPGREETMFIHIIIKSSKIIGQRGLEDK